MDCQSSSQSSIRTHSSVDYLWYSHARRSSTQKDGRKNIGFLLLKWICCNQINSSKYNARGPKHFMFAFYARLLLSECVDTYCGVIWKRRRTKVQAWCAVSETSLLTERNEASFPNWLSFDVTTRRFVGKACFPLLVSRRQTIF